MLMEKLRFVVMALVAAAAAGALVLGYRSGASEPAPPAAASPPARPAPVLAADWDIMTVGDANGPATVVTKNFEVNAPSRRIGLLIAEAAERHRKEQALLWLRKELPRWSERCKIEVKITMSGAGGATSFEFVGEPEQWSLTEMPGGGLAGSIFFQRRVKSRSMHLEGSLDRLLASALPHEITHTIFADCFGKPVVRWADEGGAVLSEDLDEQERHEKLARQIANTPGRAVALRRLVAMKDFPADPMTLYAEGYSVTHLLVDKKDRPTFLAFVKQGMEGGWDKAVKDHYGFRDVEALEDAWLAELRRLATKAAPGPLPPAPAPKLAEGEIAIPPGPPPVTGLAVIDKDGHLRLQELQALYVSVTPPIRRGAKDGDDTAGAGGPAIVKVTHVLDPKETPVYTTDGKRIDPQKLPDLLRKEIPVLVTKDGKMADPFHLQLIKRGTLIVAPPVERRVDSLPPQAVPQH